MFGFYSLELNQVIVLVFLIVFFLPFSKNKKIRYYGCYIFYVVYISAMGCLLIPFYLWRPRNVLNLRMSGVVLKHTTKVIGITWDLRNGHILKEERGAIIVANHQSALDVLGMLNIWEVMGKCTAIAKKEILYVPPFGPCSWLGGLLFIDRNNGKAAYQQILDAANTLKNEKTKLWLFPEGTRNRDGGSILPFKKGAFRVAIECQIPIIPVVFSPYYFIDSEAKVFEQGKIIISALDPISTKGMTMDDLGSIIEKTHKKMTDEYKELQEEVSDYDKVSCKKQ